MWIKRTGANAGLLDVSQEHRFPVFRCGGWTSKGGYEADYLNMLQYYRRARTIKVVQDVVGIYDAGQGLDEHGLNFRQEKLLKAGIKSRPI